MYSYVREIHAANCAFIRMGLHYLDFLQFQG